MSAGGDEYSRGMARGETETLLAAHSAQLVLLTEEVHKLTMAVQRLADQAVARDATVITTAAALKDADQARRVMAAGRWSPFQRAFAVIGALAALATVVSGRFGVASPR